jgi:hypothetical protein
MQGNSNQQQNVRDLLEVEQAYQDSFITKRLPTWIQSASAAQLQSIGETMRKSVASRRAVDRVLQRIQRIDRFAEAALQAAMKRRFSKDYAVQHWDMRLGTREPVTNSQPVGSHLTEVTYKDVPLLEAALRNFTADEVVAGGQPTGNKLVEREQVASGDEGTDAQAPANPPSAVAFGQLCRDTDIGGKYQTHLQEILQPQAVEDGTELPSKVLADSDRHNQLLDAYEARIKGVLTEQELQLIVTLCTTGELGRLDGDRVVAKQLTLLGHSIQQVVLLDVIDEGLIRNTTRRVLLHVPGDPNGAWTAFDSLRALANALGRRLRTTTYQQFFSRFLRRSDIQQFYSTIIPAYADLVSTANFDLEEHMQAYATPLFDALAAARIQQIKDDAASIAVPVAQLDREVQRRHDQRLAAEGWTLLNIAGMFVPIIGAGLLAVTAWKLMGEVYHGIEAWRDGDDSQAIDHLINVGTDVAAIAVTATGVTVASRVWNRSAWVDSLVPAELEDGTYKLWNADITALPSEALPENTTRNTLGIHQAGDRTWVEMEGNYYPAVQREANGEWQVRPSSGHGPRLCHNQAGAWRLWCEQPAQWGDGHRLFRRLGGDFGLLDDERIDQVLTAHDLKVDELRAWHVQGLAPEPEVLDSVLRSRIDQRIGHALEALRSGRPVTDATVLQHGKALPGAAELPDGELATLMSAQRRELFDRIYSASQETDTPSIAALRRAFSSLHGPAAAEIVRAASVADRQALLDTSRIPLNMGTAARKSVRLIRMARAYEGFVIDAPQNVDLARVAVSMTQHLPESASGVQWRLYEGAATGTELLSTPVGTQQFGLVHSAGRFQLVDSQGVNIGAPGELFSVMASAYTDTQRTAMGVSEPFEQNLRVMLSRLAGERRSEVEKALGFARAEGWFNPPQRLTGGRIGYPLSGRSPAGSVQRRRPQSLFAMVRSVYPSFTDQQIAAWVEEIQQEGRSVEIELIRLGRQLEVLDNHLNLWVRSAMTPAELDNRRYFRLGMINCWQRRLASSRVMSSGVETYRFTMHGYPLQQLPSIPRQTNFSHVIELALQGMALEALPDDFLHAFTGLEVLELSGNRLTQLPQSLISARHLRALDLSYNQIVINPAQATILASCESLDYLSLSHNPLGRAFSLSGMDGLRHLHLNSTAITEFPNALATRQQLRLADLRGNQITTIPEEYFGAPGWIRNAVVLDDNPLSEAAAERLRTSRLNAGRFEFNQAESMTSGDVRRRWVDAAQRTDRGPLSVAWENLQSEPRSGDFFELLNRLLETADFTNNAQYLAQRVFAMIEAMLSHATLRNELLELASQSMTCGDSVTMYFSNLELRMLVWQAESNSDNQEDALLHLGRQLWRLDEVDRIALEDVQARRAGGGNPDDIEVALAYRLGLRDDLDLPAQPRDMLYRRVAGLNAQTITSALAAVQEAETAEAVAQSLVDRDFWQTYLLRTEQARFEESDRPFHDRMEAVMNDATVLNGRRVTQMNQIRDERLAAQRTLMLEITRQKLGWTEVPVAS